MASTNTVTEIINPDIGKISQARSTFNAKIDHFFCHKILYSWQIMFLTTVHVSLGSINS